METLSADLTRVPLDTCQRLVIKVGSALLVDAVTGALRSEWLATLADDIAAERAAGRAVVVVSSGAIALGRGILGLTAAALPLEHAQAAAAVGQMRLARAWEEALSPLGYRTAQVLLTLDDTQTRRRYLNGKATLEALMGFGAIPVVNENDTTATDEIRYGDNDRLAARVALMAGADVLVLLSDVDGLYTANPRTSPDAAHLADISEITPEIEAMAGDAGSGLSRGGMKTKLMAAKTAMQGGCAMAIAEGARMHPLRAIREGARVTWFRPRRSPAAARKQWIAGMKPMGVLVIDLGAARALRRGGSLLPAGVRRVEGSFERGDPVSIVTETGEAVGAALAGYSAAEAQRIAGVRSDRIEAALGHPGRAAIAHRDDMVIWGM
ncbi:glutamate 5-kinase [Limibaculum sp. FT325]|uniref:glutamate 5-kinase n=1 Tax=Thermohalobaculum sediminis TaxID=2939436 RepID=UPI0020BFF80E|nr:glutamate 5-kinase [Limibaculum sediminis]MCL5778856.1 glutamate 5-kinase [Limibaculum sediminis]